MALTDSVYLTQWICYDPLTALLKVRRTLVIIILAAHHCFKVYISLMADPNEKEFGIT